MGRQLRIDPEAGWHYVMNRGAGRRDVFLEACDRRQFLRLVAEGCKIGGVEVHAFCLMNNHFHLLLHCPDGGLSVFMQRLGSMYTRFLNDRVNSDGPIFRGRFRSLAVDSSQYLDYAARYVHRNPLDIQPPVALDSYRWSSYRYYVNCERAPEWLTTDLIRDAHGGRAGYRTFVEGSSAVEPAPISWAIDTAIAESDEDTLFNMRHIKRAVAAAMLTTAALATAERVEQWLAIPNSDAHRMVLNRSRIRVAASPVIGQIARRAGDLAA